MSGPSYRSRYPAVLAVAMLSIAPLAAQQSKVFTTGTPSELALVRQNSLDHIRALAERHSLGPGDLVVTRVWVDELSMAHARVQQYFRSVPIFGGEAVVHLRADGAFFGDTDDLLSGVNVDIRPTLGTAEAVPIALKATGCSGCRSTSSSLWIVRRDAVDHFTYRIELAPLRSAVATAPVVFVDAHNGEVILRYDNIQTSIKR